MTNQQLREAVRAIIKKELTENKQYKKGDTVVPTKGPHKGRKHEVIHVNDDGTVNIKPILAPKEKNQYRQGAVKASPSDLTENKPAEAPSKPTTEPTVAPGKPAEKKPRRPLGNPEVKPGPKAEVKKATMKEAEMLKQVIKRFRNKK